MENELINDVYYIQPYGKAGFSMTLPKKWVDRLSLSKKNPVHIKELPDGRLILTPIKE
jgi:phosphate uptake regulator